MTLATVPVTRPAYEPLRKPSRLAPVAYYVMTIALLTLAWPSSASALERPTARIPVCEVPYSVGGGASAAALPPSCFPEPEPPPPPARDAAFVAQSVPTTMVVGQSYAVSVRMRNDGEMTWTAGQSFRLGSQNPGDNWIWGLNRVDVPGSVATGQEALFNFTVRAPSVAGTHNFQWQMVQDGQAWFGRKTTNVAVKVQASLVTGHIDGLSGASSINGWACSTGSNTPIDVHLYLGGAAGAGGTFVGSYRADKASEAAVAAACQASGGAYRFALPITTAMLSQHGGKTIFVHGISPVGASNASISNSGTFRIPVNQPPTVTLTQPTAGQTFQAPADITLQANASDPEGALASVTFYANDQAVATITALPYTITLRGKAAGNYRLHAVATDNLGATGTSAVTTVTVNAPPPPPPPPLPPPPPISGTMKRQYVYDAHHQLCKIIEPETAATVMAYDAAGNLAWVASGLNLPSTSSCDQGAAVASGRRVDRSYDARNRLASLSFPDGRGNQVWTYTADGLPDRVTTTNEVNNGGPVVNSYSYNRRRLLTSESITQTGWYTWTLGYGYDANGALSAQTYPSGLSVSYAPNALGQPTRAGNYATAVTYYPNGAIKSFSYGNGLTHTMTQNARQRPLRVIDTGSALDQEYSYDQNGNVTSTIDRLDGNRSRWMTYDGADRLTSAGSVIFGGDHWHRFTYDALDNMRSWSLGGVKDHRYVYDASNRLSQVQNSAGTPLIGLSYDVQGNLLSKSGQAYGFDYGNRLRYVADREWYRYDAQGRRVVAVSPVSGSILSMYSHAGQLLFDQDFRGPSAIGADHIYLGGSPVAQRKIDYSSGATAVTYQHTDALGSPVAVSNQAAQVIERTNYEPYGAAINKTAQGIGYAGHVMDAATGLTYMQQRYYDPELGRFPSVDPAAVDPSTAVNFSRYRYAANNPYSFKDPDGRQECRSCEMSYGAAAGFMLRNDPERLATWEGGERAATAAAGGGRAASEGAAIGQAAGNFVDSGDYSKAAVASVLVKAAVIAVTHGRGKNRLSPDPQAQGAHSTFKRDAQGKITNTATYEPNVKNPSGFQEIRRVDVTGKSHTNPDGAVVPTPHVSEAGAKGVRPALPEELPKP